MTSTAAAVSKRVNGAAQLILALLVLQGLVLVASCHPEPLPMGAVRLAHG